MDDRLKPKVPGIKCPRCDKHPTAMTKVMKGVLTATCADCHKKWSIFLTKKAEKEYRRIFPGEKA